MADDNATQLQPITVTAKRSESFRGPGAESMSRLDALSKQISQLAGQTADIYGKQGAESQPYIDKAQQVLKERESIQPPKYPQAPEPPDLKPRQLSAAAAIGILAASALVGKKLGWDSGAALRSLSTAYDSYNRNDAVRAQRELQNYNNQVQRFQQLSEQARREYSDVLEKNKGDLEAQRAGLDFVAAKYFPELQGAMSKMTSLKEKAGILEKTISFVQKSAELGIRAGEASDRHFGVELQRQRLNLDREKAGLKTETTSHAYVKDMFNLPDLPRIPVADADKLRDTTESVRIMDRLSRSVDQNPDLARTISKYASQASGSADNFLKITQNVDDAEVQLFRKSILDLTRAGALKLAGPRGITVTGDRIANRVLAEGTSPQGLKLVARQLGKDLRDSYTSLPNGTKLDWSKVPRLETFDEELAAGSPPLVGGGTESGDDIDSLLEKYK